MSGDDEALLLFWLRELEYEVFLQRWKLKETSLSYPEKWDRYGDAMLDNFDMWHRFVSETRKNR